jgi:hypothetical protein
MTIRNFSKEEKYKSPKYAEKLKDFKSLPKEYFSVPDKFRETFDNQQNVNFESTSGFFSFKELDSPESLRTEQLNVLSKLEALQKLTVLHLFFKLFSKVI